MRILILGAAGQISQYLIEKLLQETEHELVLYARRAKQQPLNHFQSERVTFVAADFLKKMPLKKV